jgi:phosphoadenosine phosphosulfate reductase
MPSALAVHRDLPPSPPDAAGALTGALRGLSPVDTLRVLHAQFADALVIAVSFGAEDMVLVHAAGVVFKETGKQPRLITLDTGRLPEETHRLLEAARVKYGLTFEVYSPEPSSVRALVAAKGAYSFLDSVDERKQCCHVRKVAPLARALLGARVWVTGLRRAQSVTRQDLALVENDPANATHDDGLLKVSPLVSWSERDVWRFLDEHQVPRHALHALGYPSIGCAPCTRGVADWRIPDDESAGDLIDIRAGRWWWEDSAHKECGLHAHTGSAPSSSTTTPSTTEKT